MLCSESWSSKQISTYTVWFLFLFSCLALGSLCVPPLDANVLLWKVKSNYDLNLTVLLCTFLYKGGGFIPLKKIGIARVGFPVVLQGPQSIGNSDFFFSPRDTHKWIPDPYRTALSSWRKIVLGTGLAWLPRDCLS